MGHGIGQGWQDTKQLIVLFIGLSDSLRLIWPQKLSTKLAPGTDQTGPGPLLIGLRKGEKNGFGNGIGTGT